MATLVEAIPNGALLRPMLNGRSIGIIESNTENAFAYWGQRARLGASNAGSNGESRKRVYTLQRVAWCRQISDYKPVVEYRFLNDEWRAV